MKDIELHLLRVFSMKFNICRTGKFFNIPNKFWDLQITNLFEGPFFNFNIGWTRKQDHAGFQILIEIFNFMFDFKIYDNRHWDYKSNTYEKN